MHDTNLAAFKTDLRNVNWKSINYSSERNCNSDFINKIHGRSNSEFSQPQLV